MKTEPTRFPSKRDVRCEKMRSVKCISKVLDLSNWKEGITINLNGEGYR